MSRLFVVRREASNGEQPFTLPKREECVKRKMVSQAYHSFKKITSAIRKALRMGRDLFLAEKLLEDEGSEGVGHGYLDGETDGYVEGVTWEKHIISCLLFEWQFD